MFIEQGTPEAGKGYPLRAPQDARLPAFSYQVISNTPKIAHSGRVVLERASIQVNVYGQSYDQAKALQRILRAKLDGFRGMMADVDVQFCKTVISDNWADAQESPVVSFDVTLIVRP